MNEYSIPIPTQCPACGKNTEVVVLAKDYVDWKEGKLIQNAFPYLSIDDKERLITGYCQTCWDKLMKEPEDE